jgi:hypothetical protein
VILFLATAAVVALLALWVARAFLVGPPKSSALETGKSTPLAESKLAVYRSMLDLEEDFSLGKVSREDRDILRSKYEHEAVDIIQRSRQHSDDRHDALDEQLEREIAKARRALARPRAGGLPVAPRGDSDDAVTLHDGSSS